MVKVVVQLSGQSLTHKHQLTSIKAQWIANHQISTTYKQQYTENTMSLKIIIIRLLTTIFLYALDLCLYLGTFTCLVYHLNNDE